MSRWRSSWRTPGSPAAIRNNAGGHWNHTFFWQIMAPEGQRGEPSAELTAAINESFGSMDEFKKAFQTAGTSRFGSGWAWLIVDADKKLGRHVHAEPGQPADGRGRARHAGARQRRWEHAYYLTYNNRRADYLSRGGDAVNWNKVSEHYARRSRLRHLGKRGGCARTRARPFPSERHRAHDHVDHASAHHSQLPKCRLSTIRPDRSRRLRGDGCHCGCAHRGAEPPRAALRGSAGPSTVQASIPSPRSARCARGPIHDRVEVFRRHVVGKIGYVD